MEQVACAPRVARERAGALRNGGGAEWQRASEASECPEGHRSESGGASEGIGSPRASVASEGLLPCARVCVRAFRAHAYGRILYLSGL